MQVRAILPDHIVRQRSMSRTKKPVGWDERQRNPSPRGDCRSKTMGLTEPVIGPARGPHRARAMGPPRFGPDSLVQPILRASGHCPHISIVRMAHLDRSGAD
jgi:hypothetical protein